MKIVRGSSEDSDYKGSTCNSQWWKRMGPGSTNSYVDSRAEYEIKKKWKTVGYVEIDHVHTIISSGLIAVRLSR